MYKLIDGKKLAQEVLAQVQKEIIELSVKPQLAVILVGNDPASHLYVRLKKKACEKAGIVFHLYRIDESENEQHVLDTISFLNKDSEIDAILIQLPLPKKFDQQRVVDAMDYRKDVDGFHKKNLESFLAGKKQHILPGLSLAIWNLIASTGAENYVRKKTLIIGKSDIFTQPTRKILSDKGMEEPTIVHPSDRELADKIRAADILITAVGKPRTVSADMVKDGAIIIDVGISSVDGQTVGDVDFKNVAPKTSYITPVPGGVGPMTVAMLLYNTLQLSKERK
ncbi:MAG: bifunctional 5,10-methylenetetrahydrofolate dehydrogenase/5,10-methenyltetrahydrofolate cyclohydrolase, partial [Patescibacteria group bacterium]